MILLTERLEKLRFNFSRYKISDEKNYRIVLMYLMYCFQGSKAMQDTDFATKMMTAEFIETTKFSLYMCYAFLIRPFFGSEISLFFNMEV